MRTRATEALDPELDLAAERVAEALREERPPVSRSLLLAIFSDAIGSEARARASLGELEERLRVWGTWMPPGADTDRVEARERAQPGGYREPAASTVTRLSLRPQPLEHALHIASPILVFGLAIFFLSRQDWFGPALWIPFAVLQLALYLRARRRRRRIAVEVDDRRVRAGDVEVERDDVRYVTARGRALEVGLGRGRPRVLLDGLATDDAVALAAGLENELRLLGPRRRLASVRARVDEAILRDDDHEGEEAAFTQGAHRMAAKGS